MSLNLDWTKVPERAARLRLEEMVSEARTPEEWREEIERTMEFLKDGWEAEKAAPADRVGLPKKLHLSGRILLPEDARGERGWFVRDEQGGLAPLAIYHHGAFPHPSDIPLRLLQAMVTAYNRERAEVEQEGRWATFAHERNVKAAECELALSHLARKAAVTHGTPDEIVENVLAKLNATTEKEQKRPALADFPGSIEYSVRYDPEGVGVLGVLEGDQPWRYLTADEAREAARRWRLGPSLQAHLLECETALNRLAREAGAPDDGPDEIAGEVLEKISRLSVRTADPTVDEIIDLGPRSQPFAHAVAALAEVRRSFSEAMRNGVKEGRFTNTKGAVTVELQWPWHGGYPQRDHEFRFYVEGRYNPKPVESKK